MKFSSLILAALTLAVMPLSSSRADDLIDGAKLCTRHLPRYERENGIPTHLLSAIAATESGRYHEGLGIKLPWPWTINAEGKGYMFNSKEEAIAAVRKLRAHGIQSIDVGCMQVNLYHHPNAFSSLEEAFEPEANIAYAAGFLRDLYQEEGSWKKAAGDYHSKTPKLGAEYVGEVYNIWFDIIDKLRAARLQVPDSSVMAAAEAQSVPVHPAHEIHAGPYGSTQTASYHAPHMNSIHVITAEDSAPSYSQNRKDSGLIVVTPEVSPEAVAAATSVPETLTVAQAKPVETSADIPAGAKVVHVDDPQALQSIPASAPVSSRKTGPNFIFND